MKNACDLSDKEKMMIYEKNSAIREDVFDRMMDDAAFWCGEYLSSWDGIGGIDYEIGYDRGAYFRVTDECKFLYGLRNAQAEFGFLADEYTKTIDYCLELIDRRELIPWNDEKNYDRITERINELIDDMESACFKRFMDEFEYCFDDQAQIDYYRDNYEFTYDQYVDDDYILYEDIKYTKCYA